MRLKEERRAKNEARRNRPRHLSFFVLRSSLFLLIAATFDLGAQMNTDVTDLVEHAYAENDGVRIHYVSLGRGPLIVMIHGFPDFWYSWRHQMVALAETHRVVALDMRGYNRSDKPRGQEAYDLSILVEDVAAVVRHAGAEKAVVVGHDWGGMVAWQFAMRHPEMTDRLVILNLPHPRGLMRELANNPEQQRNSQYARDFQQPGAHESLTAEGLASWVRDERAREVYVDAFQRSDFEAMLYYYRQNYPREPYREDTQPVIKVQAPVLMFHGLDDQFLLHGALAGTWEWVNNVVTLVTIPGVGHWVQEEAAEYVSAMMKAWLAIQSAKD